MTLFSCHLIRFPLEDASHTTGNELDAQIDAIVCGSTKSHSSSCHFYNFKEFQFHPSHLSHDFNSFHYCSLSQNTNLCNCLHILLNISSYTFWSRSQNPFQSYLLFLNSFPLKDAIPSKCILLTHKISSLPSILIHSMSPPLHLIFPTSSIPNTIYWNHICLSTCLPFKSRIGTEPDYTCLTDTLNHCQ